LKWYGSVPDYLGRKRRRDWDTKTRRRRAKKERETEGYIFANYTAHLGKEKGRKKKGEFRKGAGLESYDFLKKYEKKSVLWDP